MAERKVMALQRFIKRVVEREVFAPLIGQMSLDPKRADCRLVWGLPERPEVGVGDVVRLAEVSAQSGVRYVSVDEVRRMLVKLGFDLSEPLSSQSAVKEE